MRNERVMTGLRPALSDVRSVLVFRALKLGDMLCAVPAFRTLRAGLPGARITLLGLASARLFAARFKSYIDEFIEFPGYPGLPEKACDPAELSSFVESIRGRRFDLVIQMHGSGTISNGLVSSLGARRTAGFYPPGAVCPDPALYALYPETVSEINRNLSLMVHLGFTPSGTHLEFPLDENDEREVNFAPRLRHLPRHGYVCIHPGASVREKCWPVENFASIARFIRKRGLPVVITGNRDESDLAAWICETMDGNCIDAASLNLELGSLALLIRDSRLLVCNDTAVSHLASALRVASVVIFTIADPARWAPLDSDLHRAVGGNGIRASVEEVTQAVRGMLERQMPVKNT